MTASGSKGSGEGYRKKLAGANVIAIITMTLVPRSKDAQEQGEGIQAGRCPRADEEHQKGGVGLHALIRVRNIIGDMPKSATGMLKARLA